MSFDWRTEEPDNDWRRRSQADQPSSADGRVDPSARETELVLPGRAGGLAYIAVASLLLVALGAILYGQIDRRAAEGRRRAEAEVLASHEMIRRAVTAGDVELFTGFLSGSDAEWATAQKQLVLRDRFTARSAFGLDLIIDDSPALTPTLTFTPDLRSAELATWQRYAIVGGETDESITLKHTVIFRRGEDRWLLSPPATEFWGGIVTSEGHYVRLRYPSRDAAVAERLATDLDAILADLCAGLSRKCPTLTVNLSTHSDDLAAYVNPSRLLQGGEVTLPAPTLFGTPVDEAGYQALYREFAVRVVSAAVANYAGWSCCEDALFYSELLEAQLDELGLRPWPVTVTNFERLIADPAVIDRLWGGTTVTMRHSEIWPIHALVDFLTREIDHVPVLDMQRLLLAENIPSYWNWINEVTKRQFASRSEFDRELLRYAARHRAVKTPPIPLPDQNLQLACWVGDATRPALFRYELASGTLLHERELASTTAPVMVALPARDGVVVGGHPQGAATQTPFIWRDGRATEIAFTNAPPTDLVPMPPTSGGPSLLTFGGTAMGSARYALLPLESCAGEQTCSAHDIPGAPTFSPNHEHSLLAEGGSGSHPILFLGDGQGRLVASVGPGSSPFWLDNDTFGYVVLQGEGRQSVVVRDVGPGSAATFLEGPRLAARSFFATSAQQPEPKGGSRGKARESVYNPTISEARELFSTTDLEAIPYLDPTVDKTIDHILVNPNTPELFIITDNARQPAGLSYVIGYDLTDGSMTARFSFAGEPGDDRRLYNLSPDGRWLVVGVPRLAFLHDGGTAWELFLHGIGELAPLGLTLNQTIVSESSRPADWLMDWSADGRWLALTTNGYIRLVAPGENYTLPLILDDANCAAAVWVNEE